jgi:hypothetical protein
MGLTMTTDVPLTTVDAGAPGATGSDHAHGKSSIPIITPANWPPAVRRDRRDIRGHW